MQELNAEKWNRRNFLANVKPKDGKYLTVSLAFGANISTQKVDDEESKVQNKLKDDFNEWIPNKIKSSVITIPTEHVSMTCHLAGNTTSLPGIFQGIATQFAKIYKRYAFLHG